MVESDETKDLRAFMTLFTFAKKSDLERYAETAVVTQSAFARFVVACQDGSLPFKHAVHYSRSVSEPHLPSDTDLRALADNGVGPLGADAAKTLRKLGLFMRLGRWSAGHMFYTAGFFEWHFFVFDQNDQAEWDNHWVHGKHLHFVNWLWPHLDPRIVWSRFVTHNEKPTSLHIRQLELAAEAAQIDRRLA